MKHLIEISKIVTKKKVKKIEIFDESSLKNKNSKFNEFYESLMDGKFKSDRDAAKTLYDCQPTDDRYRQLKSRFRKRMLNTLFFLDVNTPATSNYNRAYYSVNKDWTIVKILEANSAPHTAADIAKQILTVALKFKFADVIVNCSRILRDYYSIYSEDEKNYEEYDQYAKQYQDVLNAEIRSEELYQRVIMNYHKPPMKAQSLSERIDTYCDALIGLSEAYESPIIRYNMYMVWIYRYEMMNDYNGMLEVCKNAEAYISQNPLFYRDDMLAGFQIKEMIAYLHLRDFKRGKANAEKCLRSFPEGSDIWFDFMEYYFLLSMHTENYVNAIAVFNGATNHTRFKKLPVGEREKWNLYEGFVVYIIESQGEQNPAIRAQSKSSSRVNRFLSDAPNYPKDQRLLGVYYLIVQTLIFLDKKSYSAASERIQRLQIIATRQLKKEEHYRTIQFIRLLYQLVRADFKHDNLIADNRYFERLENNTFKYRNILSELEIIPYEALWTLITARMKR